MRPVLQRKGVSGYILDLRENPGGLVKSGIDIARLLLDGHPTVFSITGREGEPVQQVGARKCMSRRALSTFCVCAVYIWFSVGQYLQG